MTGNEELGAVSAGLHRSVVNVQSGDDERLRLLAATFRHQLGQPLTAIANYAGALRYGCSGDERVRNTAGKIIAQTRTASEILEQLHELADPHPTDYGPAEPERLVRHAMVLAESKIESIGAEVRLHLPSGLPEIRIAPGQLQQVLMNLVANALEAVADSDVRRLTVGAERSGGYLELRVSDTGCGIAAHRIERLFDPFYTTKQGGMGMGLSICRDIVAGYGGRLWAESPGEDAGSTFHLRLPVAEDSS